MIDLEKIKNVKCRTYIDYKGQPICVDDYFEYKQFEKDLGIDLSHLFDSTYTSTMFEMELEKEDKQIFFDGDNFYGHYTKDQFLDLIRNMISMYKQLVALDKK